MYLSKKDCFYLDEIIKSFEVAYRTYIARTLISKYPTFNSFNCALNSIDISIGKSPLIFSHRYKDKISKILRKANDLYNTLNDCINSYHTKDYNNSVPYVSDILDYSEIFFNDCFSDLAIGFSSIDEFNDYSSKYLKIRNALAHPASSKIQKTHAKEIISFIKHLLTNINDDNFWFTKKKDIASKIEDFIKEIENNPLKHHNLQDIYFPHKQLICREKELEILNNFIFGKGPGYRRSGSVIVYGYGGVGKTALLLEFIYKTIKDILDEQIDFKIEFILFYSSKEEILTFKETSRELYINDIRKQISSFSEFRSKFFEALEINDVKELENNTGLIFIDNFETLSEDDKIQFYDFIKRSPRTIQYVITSRNEETCEDKLHLKEFQEINSGLNFIDEYIKVNNYEYVLTDNNKKELLALSKGNTLIIVLSLQQLANGGSIEAIINDLKNIESGNNMIIADFMYKNTINHTIFELEKSNYKPIGILKVISLYDVPIDLYSLSHLSNQNIRDVENICNILTTRLILEKHGESFRVNDFANKFILSKYLPNNVEKKEIKNKIREYQKDLNYKLETLEKTKTKEPLLKGIMEDWKPKNSIDKIAIAETFMLFGETKKAIQEKNYPKIKNIRNSFDNIEKMTSHPYIKFQKARCYEQMLQISYKNENKEKIIKIISTSYEEAIEATVFYYPFIRNTKSYGSINWIYGLFVLRTTHDYSRALRLLEDAISIFQRLGIKDKTYFTIANNISYTYVEIYKSTKDKRYLNEMYPIYQEIVLNKSLVTNLGFHYSLYRRNFDKYFYNHKIDQ